MAIVNKTNVKINNRKDILLLLLYVPGKSAEINEPISGRTRLVKMIFLFRNEIFPSFKKGNIDISLDRFYDFSPYDYGPFSKDVYDDINFFQLKGFVESTPSDETVPEAIAEYEYYEDDTGIDFGSKDELEEYQEESFKLSEKGLKFTSNYYQILTPPQREMLTQFKSRMNSLSLKSILLYVYQKYPNEISKSKIVKEVLDSAHKC